jgi:sulfatase maturation enzyme AslB (radical SAM superfamily)
MDFIKFEKINKNKSSIHIEWRFSILCNFDCSYCDTTLHDKIFPTLSKDSLKRSVDQIVSLYPNKRIQLSLAGGEPFAQKNIYWLLKYLKIKNISYIHTSSNGSYSLEKYLHSFNFIDSLSISYHFERERGDSLIKKIIKIKNALPSNKYLGVYIMLSPGKLSRTKELTKILHHHNIKFSVRKIILKNTKDESGEEQGGTNFYSKEEKDYLKKFISLKKNIVGTRRNGEKINFNWNDLISMKLNNYREWKCFIGSESLLILENGDIFRGFCKVGGKIGNIFEQKQPYLDTVNCTRPYCNAGIGLSATKCKTYK